MSLEGPPPLPQQFPQAASGNLDVPVACQSCTVKKTEVASTHAATPLKVSCDNGVVSVE